MRSKEYLVENTLMAAASNPWYGDIIIMVGKASEGIAPPQIRAQIVRERIEKWRYPQEQIHVPIEDIEQSAEFLRRSGVLRRSRGRYYLTQQTHNYWENFQEALSTWRSVRAP